MSVVREPSRARWFLSIDRFPNGGGGGIHSAFGDEFMKTVFRLCFLLLLSLSFLLWILKWKIIIIIIILEKQKESSSVPQIARYNARSLGGKPNARSCICVAKGIILVSGGDK